jgi:hypothetical protein
MTLYSRQGIGPSGISAPGKAAMPPLGHEQRDVG